MTAATPGELDAEFLSAVETNDLPGAAALIRRGTDVNRRGPLPYTLLMIAAGRGYVEMTGLLLAAGADVFAIDSTLGASPLHKAAQSGVVDVARLILDHGAFINLQSATVGHTPLIDAVWSKQPAMVRFLLDRGAAIAIKTHYQGTVWDFVGTGPAWTAGGTTPESEPWGASIRALLDAKQQADAAARAQPLMQAVLANDLGGVRQAIAAGADVNEKSPVVGGPNDGQTPLLAACFAGRTEIVRELIAAGANPRIVDYLLKATPGHKAAFSGHAAALRILLQQGEVEINAQGPYNGYTALHDTVWHGHVEAASVVLDFPGVRLDLRGHDGHTPLELAQALGYTDIATLIRERM